MTSAGFLPLTNSSTALMALRFSALALRMISVIVTRCTSASPCESLSKYRVASRWPAVTPKAVTVAQRGMGRTGLDPSQAHLSGVAQ